MTNVVVLALISTLFTWMMTVFGAATVIFFKSTNQRLLNLMLGFAAGVMISASFWSLLQPAIERATEARMQLPWVVVTFGFLCGALFIWGSDKTVTHAQKRLREADGRQSTYSHRVFLLVLSITLHNVPEGLAVGVAFGALCRSGFSEEALWGAITVAVGIALQNFPEGAAVAFPLRRDGYSRGKSFFWGQASGMVEPIAGVIGAISVSYVESLLPFALSFAAGTMILVSVHELIPECQQNKDASPYFSTMGIVLGFAMMMLLDLALG